jgi:hypothetical protein
MACRLIITRPIQDGGSDVEAAYEDVGEMDGASRAGLKVLYSDARKRYSYTTRLLRRLGFTNLAQVEAALGDYDDDRISRIMWGSRQGQLSRFEDVILVSMGEGFIGRHPGAWARDDSGSWWTPKARLRKVSDAGITIGSYVPL